MTKLCECGCGQPTKPAARTNRRLGKTKGQPQRFVIGHQADRSRASTGLKRDALARANISAARKGKGLGHTFNRGKKRTPEQKAQMKKRRPRGSPDAAERAAISERSSGAKNKSWTGGVHVHQGYRKLRAKGHPFADRHGYVWEHRLVMERVIGRYLLPSETVHHINRDKADNQASNLILCSSHAEHMRHHHYDQIAVQSAVATLRAKRPDLLAPGVA